MAGPFQGSDLNPARDKSGQGGASPREYNMHQRHASYAKRRHDGNGINKNPGQLGAFLIAIAAKLSSTSAVIYAKVTKYGAARVKAATNISQLP